MNKPKFSIAYKDEPMAELVKKADRKILALWAVDCAGRVLPYFEKKYPEDRRPRKAIEALKAWIKTGLFRMSEIRKASLDSHAAARRSKEDSAACSAARAAGQAVATAHVGAHSLAAANYALQAVYRANDFSEGAAVKERKWQYRRLIKLINFQK